MRHTVFTSDTTPAANKVQLELLRRMSPRQRLQRTFAWSRQLKQMSFDAIRRSHPNLDENGVRLKFIETTYGKRLGDGICTCSGNPRLNEYEELVAALRPVVNALQRLGVRHYVGGSVASSFHGAARSTMDVDLVCELTEIEIPEFIRWLGSDYYLSETAICEAVKRKGCFNLIHLSSSFKVDIFISRGRPFDVEAMERASRVRLGETQMIELPIATVEDSMISKLEWYWLTDEVSERQWDDVSRLLALHEDDIDRDYLERAAQSVGVQHLLQRLLEARH